MRNILVLAAILILNVQTLSQVFGNEGFESYFDFYEEIKISSEILLGDISVLDCFNNKYFLVTDLIGNEVYLVNNKGDLMKKLDPEECHPGFRWRPLFSFFNQAGNIYVINSAPWGFRFGKIGECLGPMDKTFLATYSFAFANDSSIIGYYTGEDGNYLKKMNYNGKEISRFGIFPEEYKNFIHRFEAGGVVCDKDNNIYQVNLNSPKIIKYNSKGKMEKEFGKNPSYFRKISDDISNNPNNLINEISKKLASNTLVDKIFLLSDKMIAVQLIHKTGKKKDFPYGLEIYDLDGNYLLKEEINYNFPVLTSEDGYIYFSSQPKADEKGNLPNPNIISYKFK